MQDQKYKTFLFEYNHLGRKWNFEVFATDENDAINRVENIRQAKYVGEVVLAIPARLGLLARCLCWIRNVLFRFSGSR